MPTTHLPEIVAKTGTRKLLPVSGASDMQFSTEFLSGKRNASMRFVCCNCVCVCVCPGTDISAAVTSIGVKFCVMGDLSSGQVFCPFGGNIFRGHQIRGQERGSGGPFLASQTPII